MSVRIIVLFLAFSAACSRFPAGPDDTTAAALALSPLLRTTSQTAQVNCDAGLVNSTGQTGTMSSWTIILNGGSGWAVVNFDAAAPGFGTSFSMGSKSQEVDLLANGFTASYLDSAPAVYFGEKFLKRFDVTGITYYLRVELRNASHTAIQTYNSGNLNPMPGSGSNVVYPLTSSFSGYGSGLRYIYWEDGGDDVPNWAGQFGPYLHGAYLRLTNSCGLPY